MVKRRVSAESYEDFIEEHESDNDLKAGARGQGLVISEEEVKIAADSAARGKRSGIKKLCKLFRSVLEHSISDEAVYFEVLELSSQHLPAYFLRKHNTKHWPQLRKPFKNYIKSLYLSMKHTNRPEVLTLIFEPLATLLPLKQFYSEYTNLIVKCICKLWAEGEKPQKLLCLSLLRRLYEGDFTEKVSFLKTLFLQYAANTKHRSWASYESQELMQKSFIDLVGVTAGAGYQVLFVYIRQLALHLLQVVKNPSSDNPKTVFNWQFLNSFTLLGQCILHHPGLFKELLHPLVQLACGLLKVNNIAEYFPYKLHVLRVLIALETSFGLFIPDVSAHLLQMIGTPSLYKHSKSMKTKVFSFLVAIKATKDQLASELYKELLIQEACDSLVEHLATVENSIAFVETSLPVRLSLRKTAKTAKNPLVRSKLIHCVKLIEENSALVEAQRAQLNLPVLECPLVLPGPHKLRTQAQKLQKQRHSSVISHLGVREEKF